MWLSVDAELAVKRRKIVGALSRKLKLGRWTSAITATSDILLIEHLGRRPRRGNVPQHPPILNPSSYGG